MGSGSSGPGPARLRSGAVRGASEGHRGVVAEAARGAGNASEQAREEEPGKFWRGGQGLAQGARGVGRWAFYVPRCVRTARIVLVMRRVIDES